jgi:hypothetical protein
MSIPTLNDINNLLQNIREYFPNRRHESDRKVKLENLRLQVEIYKMNMDIQNQNVETFTKILNAICTYFPNISSEDKVTKTLEVMHRLKRL